MCLGWRKGGRQSLEHYLQNHRNPGLQHRPAQHAINLQRSQANVPTPSNLPQIAPTTQQSSATEQPPVNQQPPLTQQPPVTPSAVTQQTLASQQLRVAQQPQDSGRLKLYERMDLVYGVAAQHFQRRRFPTTSLGLKHLRPYELRR